MANWILVALTFVMAIFTVLVFLTYERIEWLTGAMESHSDLMMKLEAANNGVELVWWDLSVEPFPREQVHGDPVKLTRIYCGIAPDARTNQPSLRRRLKSLWRRLLYGPTAL